MARKHPQPFMVNSKQCWYVQLGTKQIRLGKDRDEAFAKYHALMAERSQSSTQPTGPAPSSPGDRTVRGEPTEGSGMRFDVLADQFLKWTEQNRKPKTYEINLYLTKKLIAAFPVGIRVGELRPAHAYEAMHRDQELGATTRNSIGRQIDRVFNWAIRHQILERRPIPSIEKPTAETRQTVIEEPEYQAMLAYFEGDVFRDVLTVCWHTGCRPQELTTVEARHFKADQGTWEFRASESKGGKSRRVVFLDDESAAITARLAAQHPQGPLFRNADGKPWDRQSTHGRMLRYGRLVGQHRCLYDFRHTFAHRLLVAGVDAMRVATLLGHKDLRMLMKVYGHLIRDVTGLRSIVNGANPVKG